MSQPDYDLLRVWISFIKAVYSHKGVGTELLERWSGLIYGVVGWDSLVAHMVESAFNAEDVSSIPESEDPLEKEMATHSSILAWEISWMEEPGGLQSIGSKRS